MKRVFAAGLLWSCLAVPAPAQEQKPAEELPTTDAIVERSIKAAGGKEVIEKMTSRTYTGTFELPAMGASGRWERLEKAPNKVLNVIDVEGFGTFLGACDGQVAWEQNPMIGFVEKSGKALAMAKLDAEFHRDLKLKELYPKMVVVKKDAVGSRPAYLVEATPQDGSVEKLYFDAETGLPVRRDAEREGAQGVVLVTTHFEDYKDVEGYKIAHTLRTEMGELAFVLKITEVKLNAEIEDAKFAKPAVK